jgi:hypothetical protein
LWSFLLLKLAEPHNESRHRINRFHLWPSIQLIIRVVSLNLFLSFFNLPRIFQVVYYIVVTWWSTNHFECLLQALFASALHVQNIDLGLISWRKVLDVHVEVL